MSRSALHRQMQRQLREHGGALPSSDPFSILDEFPPQEEASGPDGLHIHGNAKTLNLENVLATTIASDKTFRFDVCPLQTVDEIARDIPEYCTHLEPWEAGVIPRTASAAFMYVYRLGMLGLTRYQLRKLLRWENAYVRAVALLWVRVALQPQQQWAWFEPFLADPTPLVVAAPPTGVAAGAYSSASVKTSSFGTWARGLLSDFHYFNTLLPRTPVLLARQWSDALPPFEAEERRARANKALFDSGKLTPGLSCRAKLFQGNAESTADGDEEHPAGAQSASSSSGAGGSAQAEYSWVQATVARVGEDKGKQGFKVPLVWVRYAGSSEEDPSVPLALQDVDCGAPGPGTGRGADAGARPVPAHHDSDRNSYRRAPDTAPVRDERGYGSGYRDREYGGRAGGQEDRRPAGGYGRPGEAYRDRDGGRGGGYRDSNSHRDRGYDDRDRYREGDRYDDRRRDYERDRGDRDRRRSRSRSGDRRAGDRRRSLSREEYRGSGYDRYYDRPSSPAAGRPQEEGGALDYDGLLRKAQYSRPAGPPPASAPVPADLAARYGTGSSAAGVSTGRPQVGGKGYRHERDVEGQEDVLRW